MRGRVRVQLKSMWLRARDSVPAPEVWVQVRGVRVHVRRVGVQVRRVRVQVRGVRVQVRVDVRGMRG